MCIYIESILFMLFTTFINRSEELSGPEPHCLMGVYLPADLTFTQMDLQPALTSVSQGIAERIIILLNE